MARICFLLVSSMLLATSTSCSSALSTSSAAGRASLAQAFQIKAIEALNIELDAEVIAKQMKGMCPLKAGPGITLTNVTHGPGNQVNYFYEVPATTDTTHDIAARKKAARDWALQMFHQQGLAKITEKSNIVWNFVYNKPNGQRAFSMTIGPDDLRDDGSPCDNVASQLPVAPSGGQAAWRDEFPKTSAVLSAASGSSYQKPREYGDYGTPSGNGPGMMLFNPYATQEQ